MFPLTKLEALEICRDMWTWLAKNPMASKADYLRAHPTVPQDMESDCSCCQYSLQENKRAGGAWYNCSTCPLIKFFRIGVSRISENYTESTCMASAYGRWARASYDRGNDMDARRAAAQSIADAAQAEIDKPSGSQ